MYILPPTEANTRQSDYSGIFLLDGYDVFGIVYEYRPETYAIKHMTNALQDRCYTCIQTTRAL